MDNFSGDRTSNLGVSITHHMSENPSSLVPQLSKGTKLLSPQVFRLQGPFVWDLKLLHGGVLGVQYLEVGGESSKIVGDQNERSPYGLEN